jgi:uncharacterized protein YjbJ (UPF0337 family)
MGINKHQVSGRFKEVAGKVREVARRAAGSSREELKGNLKKNVGKAQARFGDVKEQIRKSRNRP